MTTQQKQGERSGEPDGASPNSLKEADFVQSLARGLLVVRSFDSEHRTQTLSEVAKRTGLTRATARRLLLTLHDLGYVSMSGRDFSLAPSVLRLGYAYLSSLGAPAIAQPFLEKLSEQVQESCSMTVLDGTEVVYVARVPTKRIFSLSLALGSRLPAYATSMGRVLLAHLPSEQVDEILNASDLTRITPNTKIKHSEIRDELKKAREQGWYVLDQELEIGLRSVAAPVFGHRGVVAAINVSTPAARVSMKEVHGEVVPKLMETAAAVSDAIQAQ